LKEPVEDPDTTDRMYVETPQLRPFMYSREIGGEMHTKIMLGTSGNKIIVKE
jgi:hypothetical protein